MKLDTEKIDDAILALLYLGLHDGARAWKGFDWDAMDRLHQQGYIADPRGKAKSVAIPGPWNWERVLCSAIHQFLPKVSLTIK